MRSSDKWPMPGPLSLWVILQKSVNAALRLPAAAITQNGAQNMLPFSCPYFTPEDLAAAKDCYDRGQIDAGPLVRQFEREIAHLLNVPESWVLCTGSGTAALEVASRLRPFETVAASVLTWPGTYCYLDRSFKPIDLAPEQDGRPEYFYQGEEDLQIFVQLWGARSMPDDWLSQNRAQHVVLDAAHNLFDPKHRSLLEQGVTVCYSFGPLKQLTTGRGGAVVSRDLEDLAVRLRAEAYCHYGIYGGAQILPGRNLGMTEPAAAIGLRQIAPDRWKQMSWHRQDILRVYHRVLGDTLATRPDTHSGHLAVARIRPGSFPAIQREMRDLGVMVGCHYSYFGGPETPYTCVTRQKVCTLPCHLRMTKEQAEQVAKDFLEVVHDIEK
jgi:dTDP-4-amino-4,6-dideoxygalactose transaminase